MAISGKSRDQCIQALRAAFGNPDRAFEFLMSGIPEGGASQDMGGDDDYGDEEGSGAGAGGMQGNPFAALAQNPNFAMIRQRIL